MSKQRIVKDGFWSDPYIEKLDPSEKLLFLYLITNQQNNIAGVYELRPKRAGFETGFDVEVVETILSRFENDGKIARMRDWVIMKNFHKHQNYKSPKIVVGLGKILDDLSNDVFEIVIDGYPMDTLSKLLYNNIILNNIKLNKIKEILNLKDSETSDEDDEPEEEIKSDKNIFLEKVLETWNDEKIIVHKKMPSRLETKINTLLKDLSEEEIIQAIKNYALILKSPNTYWNHKWTLEELIGRTNGAKVFAYKKEKYYATNSGIQTKAEVPQHLQSQDPNDY